MNHGKRNDIQKSERKAEMDHQETIRLRRNLKDAGCGAALTEKFLEQKKNGDIRGQLRILAEHRRSLLEKLHAEQKKMDCLDYLVFNIQQQDTNKIRRRQ